MVRVISGTLTLVRELLDYIIGLGNAAFVCSLSRIYMIEAWNMYAAYWFSFYRPQQSYENPQADNFQCLFSF
jgi:hypothetical protein